MLKKPCPYHKGPVNHTLKECDMLCNYFNCLGRKDEAKKKDTEDRDDNDDPRWKACSSSSADQR